MAKDKILDTYCPVCKKDLCEDTEVYRNKVTGEIVGCEYCIETVYVDLSDERFEQERQAEYDNMMFQRAKDEIYNVE